MVDAALLPPPKKSWLDVIAKLPDEKKKKILGQLKDSEAAEIQSDWFFTARREQLEPPDEGWYVWLLMSGRGFGKTAAGANWLIEQHRSQDARSSAIIASTANDLRNYCLYGPSGVMQWAPEHFYPKHIESKNLLEWPNGTVTTLLTSEKPNRIRGGNFDRAWCDEIAHWNAIEKCWDNLQFALRLGKKVKACVTTTPRPIPRVKKFLESEGDSVYVTRGATYDNVNNLSDVYINTVIKPYEGTSIGRQELYGEVLLEVEGSLWTRDMIESHRVPMEPELRRTVVSVDPAITNKEHSDYTGIVVAGIDDNKKAFVLGDHSLKTTPWKWAEKVCMLYYIHEADYVVAESNQGGEMVRHTIKNFDDNVPVKLVHASKGKVARAEPISARYEQGKVWHVGTFPELEDEMALFVPGEMKESPNRVDALVWALTELIGIPKKGRAGTWGNKSWWKRIGATAGI